MTEYDAAARRLQAALDAPPSSRLRIDLNDVRTLLAEHFDMQSRGFRVCVWPACLSEAQQLELAENVHRSMLGEDTGPDPDPGCDCTERLRAERNAVTARADQAEEARKASFAERDEWRRAFDTEYARAGRAEVELKKLESVLEDACEQTEKARDERDALEEALVRARKQNTDLIAAWKQGNARRDNTTPHAALERAAVMQGVPLVCDVDKLTAPEHERLSGEEWATYAEALGIEPGGKQNNGKGGTL